jgi:hypothetical protein
MLKSLGKTRKKTKKNKKIKRFQHWVFGLNAEFVGQKKKKHEKRLWFGACVFYFWADINQ